MSARECGEPADRFDIAGNPCTLSKLCRLEPDWAANRIRAMEADIEALCQKHRVQPMSKEAKP